MEDMFGALSLLIFGCGIYGLYAYVKMKKDGHINEILLLGKGITEQMCSNKEEFVQKALPAVLVFGIFTTLYGAVDAIHYFIFPMKVLDLITMVVFLIVLIWHMVFTTKLKKKYFE